MAKKKENIWNVPNFLTAIRIIAAVVMFPLIMLGYSLKILAFVFIIIALTDGFDGYAARALNQKTRFGRVFDPIADRIFMGLVVIALLFKYQMYSIFLIMTREIVTLPALIFYKKGNFEFDVKFVGKLTTFMQSAALPALLLDLGIFAYVLVGITSVVGLISGIYYIKDAREWAKKQKKRGKSRAK